MTNTIRIPRPPSPLPPLPSPARKWKRRDEWTAEPDKRAPEPSVGERRGIASKIIGVFAAHGYGRQ